MPVAIHAATQGRFDARLGLGASFGTGRGAQIAMGMHFSVVCSEDMPLMTQTMDVPGPDFGREGARLYERVCANWPRGTVPPAFYNVGPTSAPTLVLSGGLDPATPPRHGDRVARALGPTAQHVVVPNGGHGVMGIGCVRDVIYRFIDAVEDSEATTVDAGCVKAIPRPAAFRPLSAGASTASPP